MYVYVTPQFIADLRKDLGYSLADFANMYQVSPKTVQNWENGVTAPPANYQAQLLQLRKKLDIEKSKNNDNTAEIVKGVLITGGILAFFLWLFNDDK